MLKKLMWTGLLPVVMLTISPIASAAQTQNGRVYIVHGIPGADVGLDAAAPVDVSVNGACLLSNFQFRQVVGALTLPAGTYNIAVHVANSARPCGNAAVIGPAAVPVNGGEASAIVAHLTSEGAPTASKFVLDLSATQAGKARVGVFHTAAAPVVDVAAGADVSTAAGRAFFLAGFRNGEAASVPVPGASVQVAVYLTGTNTAAFGPAVVRLEPAKGYFFFVVGSAARGTLAVIAQDVSELGR